MTAVLGRLEPLSLREVWPHEANDFTPWLAQSENLALLSETLHLGELSEPRTEVSVGSFYIDILAKNEDGDLIVVENQFGPTDHSHLGQIMTYVGGQEGKAMTVVWIAESFRDEHRAAVDWLNASTIAGFDFFAVEIEVLKIGASAPAPHFNVVAYPNSWSRRVSRATRSGGGGELDDRQRDYVAFWSGFESFLKERGAQYKLPDPLPNDHRCRFAMGRAGFRLFAVAHMPANRVAVELLTIHPARPKAAFDALYKDREAIEAEVGEKLDWLRQDGQISSKIQVVTDAFRLTDRGQWPPAYAWLLDRMERFRNVFRDRIRGLRIPDLPQEPEAAE